MIENAPLSASDIISLYDQSWPSFQEKWDKGFENENYRSINNFTPDEKSQIEAQGRQAYSVPMASSKIDFHVEFQRKNRTEWELEAINDKNDEIKAQVGNVQFRDLENRSDMIHVESDIYDSGIGVSCGVGEIVMGFDEDLNPVPIVKNADYRDCMWDSNSVEYNRDKDALWVAKMTKVVRQQIREEHGEAAAKKVTHDNSLYGRKSVTNYLVSNQDGKEELDILTLFTHEQKVLRTYYWVLFNDYRNFHGLKDNLVALKTTKKKDADRLLREMEIPYILQGLELSEGNGVEKKRVSEIDRYLLTLDHIIEYTKTDRPHFFLSFYYSYFFAGKYWTLMDVLKSAQQFFDRYLSQIDYGLGTDIKKAYEVVVNQLADSMTTEEAIETLHNDGYIPVKMTGTIKEIRGTGVNPQWLHMLQVMKSFLEDLAGGRSFQGLSEGADESGVAIKEKKASGEGLSSLFLDNLNRWKSDLGRKLVWYHNKFDTAERVIKVAGSQISESMLQQLEQMGLYTPGEKKGVGFLKINTPLTHLADSAFELKVTETKLNESAKDKKMSYLLALAQTNPKMTELPEYNVQYLEAMGMDFSDRTELIDAYKGNIKAQSEAAQALAAQEKETQDIENAVKVGELKISQDELALKEKELEIKKKEVNKSETSNKK